MKRYGSPYVIVTDWLRSYVTTMKEIGNIDRHINRRQTFKSNRDVAILEWRQLLAG